MTKTFYSLCFLIILPAVVHADTSCGPFTINWKAEDGFARVNGERPESQKITFLKKNGDYGNVNIQWMVPDAGIGRWLGMDFVARNGKPILNVEVVRTSMDQSREFFTYDCQRKK